ncbi:MAG: hypothetical protein IKK01_02190 [Clostridia bacterium]|nr:hypothetical protein [Clostridia bacterium]
MTKSTKKNNGINRALIYAITALVVFSTLAVVGIYAKYTVGENAKGHVSAAEFYFTSDILENTPKTYTLNPGETSISFEVRNYEDILRWADNDITFDIGITNTKTGSLEGVKIMVNGEEATQGKLTHSNENATSATVTITGLENGETYTITATGSAGYVSTLSANIVVKPDENNIYYHVSPDPQGNYILLTVWTENIKGNVSVTFPGGLIPDGSDPVLYKKDIGTSFTDDQNFKDETYSSHVYRFFAPGGNATEYAVGEYAVTINGTTQAQPSTPN